MDVQAAAATAPIPQTAPAQGTQAPSPAPPSAPPVSAVALINSTSAIPAGSSGSSGASAPASTTGASNNAHPGLATLPAGPPDGSKKGSDSDSLTSGIAQLYNTPQQNVSVSFQISTNPNEIVTVFTDTKTGKVIVQFPSETMIALAKLFDKLDGSVVNKKV